MTINSDPQLNDTDLELLSAYIDRRLGDSERAALERRLSQEPVLRGVLDELRATVALLHDLEPLKPPRSFTIAAPAAAPRRFWAYPWPAIGSALVALACLLTFSYALIRSSGSSSPAAAPAPAVMQEAAAPTAAAAGGAAQDSTMRQGTAVTAAPAAEEPTAAPAAEAPMAAAGAPAAETPMVAAGAPAAETSPAPAAETPPAPAAEAAPAAPAAAAPTMMAASGAGAIATASPATPAQPQAADSAAPPAAATPASAALKSTDATSQQPYNALVATSEISSPGTIAPEQPPAAPAANSAPSGGSSNAWLIAGAVGLALLIAAGIALALRRKT